MTACDHHLYDPDGLACTRDAGHAPGCVFEARWADDSEKDEE